MGQIKFLGAILMTVLFTFVVISFAVNFGSDNNVAVDVGDDSEITSTRSDISTDLTVYRTDAEGNIETLENSTITAGSETLERVGQFDAGGKTKFGAMTSYLSMAYSKIFGGEQGSSGFGVVITSLLVFLGVVLTLLVWKTLGGKNPE